MRENADRIRSYLNMLDLSFLQGDLSSILEFLEWHYLEREPVGEGDVMRCMGELRPYLEHLSCHEDDMVSGLILGLCAKHQARGFRRGFQLGMALALELREESR